ncbi:MAG TPA: substrate-binding domain-containing protein [Streptosporangiaceae bacterium]|nr:substrate-binding domain-containing protein [Streptosporangiaceae bacterium]
MARAAGVGRQTVSNVLNGSGRVGEAARARVLDAVAALGYHPHHGARSLRSRRTGQLAYVLPHALLMPNNYIMQRFLQALAAASGRLSYNMVVVVPDGDPRDEMRRLIASRTVDAFLLSDLQSDDSRVALLADAGMPFACFGRTSPAQPQHWVDIDNRAAVVTAVEHVAGRGYTRVAFVGYRSGSHWDDERVAGFRAGLTRVGVPAGESEVLLVDEADAQQEIRSLLSRTQPGARPEAIVTGSDRLAAMIYGLAADLRLRIGRDLAVTGFDGSLAADLLHPTLTSVSIPVDEIAERVVARALRQVSDGSDESPGEVVEASLRLGQSTGAGHAPVRDESNAPLPLGQFAAADLHRKTAPAARPRGVARSVAVLVTHMTRPSVVVRLASALAVLAEQGYETIVCNVGTPAERDRHLDSLLPTRRVDGVLAISLPLSGAQVAQFALAGVALVSVDAAAAGVPQTGIDNVAGGRLAADHLIGLGHRRIGFIGDMAVAKPPAGLGFTSSANRLRGYADALAAAGIEAEAALVRLGPHDAATAAEHAAQLLKSPDPPSAIFAASDTQAIGVLAAADRLGVPVPDQLSVIGFDDIESAAFLGLSTVRQPLERSGAEGARRLCALLRGEQPVPQRQQLPIELVARTSTGPRRAL